MPPISKLFDEILASIFLLAVSSNRDEGNDISWKRRKLVFTEVVITHVCCQWRDIAIKYSKIWAYFAAAGQSGATKGQVERFKTYLERSRERPLRIMLVFLIGDNMPELKDPVRQLIELAVDNVARWEYVRISNMAPTLELISMQTKMRNQKTPYLRFLDLALTPRHDFPGDLRLSSTEANTLQLGCPNLTWIRLSIDAAILFIPPLTQVTILSLETEEFSQGPPISWKLFTELIQIPAALTALSIGDSCIERPGEWPSKPIDMKHLQHLRWGFDYLGQTPHEASNSAFPAFICNLEAPLLETLFLCRFILPTTVVCGPVPLRMSFPNLHTFRMAGCNNVSGGWIVPFAMASPKVKTIISFSNETDRSLVHYLNHLAEASHSTRLWPQLERLVEFTTSPSVNQYIQFLRPRTFEGRSRITLKVPPGTLKDWRHRHGEELNTLQDMCHELVEWDNVEDSLGYPGTLKPWPRPPDAMCYPRSWYRCDSNSFAVEKFIVRKYFRVQGAADN
ncbi:hypothetical protein CC1G_09194 [Coprinopsis cinerea okayama7|uniref:F-box domain-containing protein n=1 Tax=Coprinopsis cinerea (strain Okayama-7 / 130 / ATCC MYA-4618 / FGSC 9003) TaxID=240176 RepID=A8P9X1_COPC7|nr:hypothetical protein CC1G_09194 [Coprinopsis cinerea okayama7\|eukprot:XP_001839860.1 hypothetical protein CC1G_09194 [Coprinopsis cinerea okayama7\